MDINQSLAHTKWNCKYHIVFAPKYRRKVFYKEKRGEVGKILRTLCEWKKIKIVEAEVCPDHVHMLVEIPPKVSVSSFMGYLKGKSSLMIYEKFPELKYKYRNREFWCRGYYVGIIGLCPHMKYPRRSRGYFICGLLFFTELVPISHDKDEQDDDRQDIRDIEPHGPGEAHACPFVGLAEEVFPAPASSGGAEQDIEQGT